MIEQIAHGAADQLHRTFGQQVGFDDQLDEPGSEIRGGTRRLDQAGDARDKRRRKLLQRSPCREVEGVDLHGHPTQRRVDVLPDELAGLAQLFRVAIDQHRVVGQFSTALAPVGEQNADAAIDIELRVIQGRTGTGGQRIELLAVLAQV